MLTNLRHLFGSWMGFSVDEANQRKAMSQVKIFGFRGLPGDEHQLNYKVEV